MSDSKITVNAPSLLILDTTQPHTFITPEKKINEGHDVPTFLTSKAYADLMIFLLQLNRAMFPCALKDITTSRKTIYSWDLDFHENIQISEEVAKLNGLITVLDSVIDEIPPDPGPRRFGNASFREWYLTIERRMDDLLNSHLPSNIERLPSLNQQSTAMDEIRSYFLGSFGSSQRLDYGSGHELSFLAFLGCIWKLGGFQGPNTDASLPPGNTERAIVLCIIDPYLQLIRRLIKTYTLEPAGSHGVWGLDDHSFIPYIFGSAQYGPPISPQDRTPLEGSRNGTPDPADVAKLTAVERERGKNMYFGAIGFIHDVKKGPFWEHSPMLYDISGVRAGWGKINKGMIKMYNAEVLSKFPVVQHFRFGSLFSWEQDPNAAPPPPSVHTSNQPIRDVPGPSLENASARGPPQEGTKAPWASKPASLPSPGMGTTTPWANRTPAGSVPSAPPTRFPPPTSRDSLPVRTQMPQKAADGTTDGSSMLPPTRAPWAKPP